MAWKLTKNYNDPMWGLSMFGEKQKMGNYD